VLKNVNVPINGGFKSEVYYIMTRIFFYFVVSMCYGILRDASVNIQFLSREVVVKRCVSKLFIESVYITLFLN
jgi:hypothetical protein